MQIAVLITCHNRKNTTLSCLQNLFAQILPADLTVNVYLVDDGSTDGTSDAIGTNYPSVHIIPGDGNCFWCGGMRLAWEVAARDNPDFFLWLNDDTRLYPQAIRSLYETWSNQAKLGKEKAIIVGSCLDPDQKRVAYGGAVRSGRGPMSYGLVQPSPTEAISCDTFAGNCVLVPQAAWQILGNMGRFRHEMGDFDYGLRAKKAGVPRIIAPGVYGECQVGVRVTAWGNKAHPWSKRVKILFGPKGIPIPDRWLFLKTHCGMWAPLIFPIAYIHAIPRLFLGNPKASS